MPSRSQRHLPIPPTSTSSTAAIHLYPPQTSELELSPPRAARPRDAPNMSPMSGSRPKHPNDRGHSRSISNPFAGLGRMKDKITAKNDSWDSDSDDDDDVTFPLEPESPSHREGAARGGPGNGTDEGKCPTCDATVRWPRRLNVFRCSNCLMVTDLEPDAPESQGFDGHGDKSRNGTPGGTSKLASKVIPLTANQTRGMIGGCLNMYFDILLDKNSRSWLSLDDDKKNKPLPDIPPMQIHVSTPSYSSPSRTAGSRSRSASQSSGRERFTTAKDNSSHLTPHHARREGNDMYNRARANSDLQSSPLPIRRPQDNSQAVRPEFQSRDNHPHIFKEVENIITTAFRGCDCLNESFSTYAPPRSARSASSGNPPTMKKEPPAMPESGPAYNATIFEPDAKTLLLGDLSENSTWWMNEWAEAEGQNPAHSKEKNPPKSERVSWRSPRINWVEVAQWYHSILSAGSSWAEQWKAKRPDPTRSEADAVRARRWETIDPSLIGEKVSESRLHLQRVLLKATESLLKRPRRLLKKPEDTRFLFILLANPLLSSPTSYSHSPATAPSQRESRRPSHPKDYPKSAGRDGQRPHKESSISHSRSEGSNHHYGLIKRILGLMANLPNDCHHRFVGWAARFSVRHLEQLVELVGKFLNYRLNRQRGRKRPEKSKNGNGDDLIPSFASASGNTPAELHAAISRPHKKSAKETEPPFVYEEDWQIRAAARVLSLLFAANISDATRRSDGTLRSADLPKNPGPRQGHMIPISAFYNTLLDYSDLVADFEIWESRVSKFSFCQYPFLLSIWAKIHIMEHDARRQMEVKARDAFFNSVLNHRAVSQYLVLKVRRECLVEDSLKGIGEVVGTGQEEIKKGLRVEFLGEEGIDAGGLRKEWFLLLVREIFDPDHGLFVYDDDSKYCYFNPHCFESSEQFYLVGVLLGLAIYNSTILDVGLPPFAFKKLLSAAPQTSGPQMAASLRPNFKCTLEDLAEFRPALAKGLRVLLEFEGDVEETFCYDFVAQVDRYGEVISVPLCENGENRPVTNSNRREFVELYVRYMLNTAVARQFEPFKRGFFTVCSGNALALFRPEEIELLVCGSDEPLDVSALRAVANYENWSHPRPETLPVVRWFWEFFENAKPKAQRKILSFITGSDRIPAMGATSLIIKLACLGDDCPRYPIARTCFNTLGLYRYSTREKFLRVFWEAVVHSEGFGLK
ncbi:hypothetical protein N7461_009449 [Penicillium sp. DV-2018c]|nr:hypothetical protein N7461_009449 [Penicillium sp. DV-2018c]